MRNLSLFVVAVLLLPFAAEAGGSQEDPTIRSDEQIKRSVVEDLAWNDRVDASDIQVEVDLGRVILTGTVPTYRSREIAAEEVESVAGVISVKNRLQVVYDSGSSAYDALIRSHLESRYAWNSALENDEIRVGVDNGHVTLSGTVDAYWKKIRAEALAFDVEGVVTLTNEIAVVPEETVLDAQIARDVIAAIDRNPQVPVDSVDVSVEDGVVELSGVVTSAGASRAATEAASRTLGVVDVRNNLIVSGVGTIAPSSDDLRGSVRDQLAWDPRVDESDVTVAVNGGVITLTGTVDNYTQKLAAGETAGAVPGVARVNNEIVVLASGEDRVPQRQLASTVDAVLSARPDLSDDTILVTAIDGDVVLGGTVDSYWEKVDAGTAAAEVVGVTDVQNELAVVPTERPEDARIAREIVAAFDRRTILDAEQVDVRVADGIVTLSGTVATGYQRRLAVDVASNTTGVRNVVSDISVVVPSPGGSGGE